MKSIVAPHVLLFYYYTPLRLTKSIIQSTLLPFYAFNIWFNQSMVQRWPITFTNSEVSTLPLNGTSLKSSQAEEDKVSVNTSGQFSEVTQNNETLNLHTLPQTSRLLKGESRSGKFHWWTVVFPSCGVEGVFTCNHQIAAYIYL